MGKHLKSHTFCFNPKDNGGEAVTLKTDFAGNEDDIYTTQTLTLNSYGNSASFELGNGQLTPKTLRELANQLEQTFNSIQVDRMKLVPINGY